MSAGYRRRHRLITIVGRGIRCGPGGPSVQQMRPRLALPTVEHRVFVTSATSVSRAQREESQIGALVEQLRWLASMGIETVFGWVVGMDQITPWQCIGREVIPAVADL